MIFVLLLLLQRKNNLMEFVYKRWANFTLAFKTRQSFITATAVRLSTGAWHRITLKVLKPKGSITISKKVKKKANGHYYTPAFAKIGDGGSGGILAYICPFFRYSVTKKCFFSVLFIFVDIRISSIKIL